MKYLTLDNATSAFITLLLIMVMLIITTTLLAVTGTVTTTQDLLPGHLEKGVTVGDGNWIKFESGGYNCYVYSSAWTDSNVDVEFLVDGTIITPITVVDIDVSALVNVIANTWGQMTAMKGYYRIEVEGADTINWRCGRYSI